MGRERSTSLVRWLQRSRMCFNPQLSLIPESHACLATQRCLMDYGDCAGFVIVFAGGGDTYTRDGDEGGMEEGMRVKPGGERDRAREVGTEPAAP